MQSNQGKVHTIINSPFLTLQNRFYDFNIKLIKNCRRSCKSVFPYNLIQRVMPDDRHECSRNAVSCAVYSCNKLGIAIIVHPVKISADDILGKKQNKRLLKSIFTGKHCSLDPFSISDTCHDIPVLLFNYHALLNNFCGSFFNFFFKYNLLFYKILLPYSDIHDN